MKYRILILLLSFFLAVNLLSQEKFLIQFADSVLKLEDATIIYDPAYVSLVYPGGDVPSDRGVCTDVIIRAYRMFGVDLQKEVHEDMRANFSLYPNNWGLTRPDRNIDHRRVPNLMKYFSRFGNEKPITRNPDDYKPGHIVCWDLGRGITHIGVVVKRKSRDGRRFLILHNIGGGQVVEDILFDFKIIGHYSYVPDAL